MLTIAQQQLLLLTIHDPLNNTRVRLISELIKEKQDEIVSTGFNKDDSILLQSLDKSLRSFNVETGILRWIFYRKLCPQNY